MKATVGPSADVRRVLAGAYGGASRSGVVGTEHLLAGLTRGGGTAGSVLAEFDITMVTVGNHLRDRVWTVVDDDPAAADAADLGPLEWVNEKRTKAMTYTGAARAALGRAVARAAAAGRTEVDVDDVLVALLAAPNRAGELLTASGVAPGDVVERLAGGPPPDRPGGGDLAPTRDALLGHVPYPVRSISGRLAYGFLRAIGANLAHSPCPWISQDARDQARRLGHRKVRTAHVLLAVLATYEVVRGLPHLVEGVEDRYAGARALVDAGVTYSGARAVVAAEEPKRDPRGYRFYVDRRTDTTAVVTAILDGDTSASRVLRELGVDPATIR